MKNIWIPILRVVILVCLPMAVMGIDAMKPFVNKPWQTLTDDEREQNMAYVNNVTGKNQEIIDPLIALLTDPQTCFLPREALMRLGSDAVVILRQLVKEDARPLVVRSEALSILAELGDCKTAELLEKDPLIRKNITSYDEVHHSAKYIFQVQYVKLKLHGLSRNKKADVLTQLLKEECCVYVVMKELALLGKDATEFVVKILNSKEAPYLSRLTALNVITEIHDPKAAPFVMQVLQDRNEKDQLRALAANALGIMGDTGVIEMMQLAAEEWNPAGNTGYDVRAAVEKAVKALREKNEHK